MFLGVGGCQITISPALIMAPPSLLDPHSYWECSVELRFGGSVDAEQGIRQEEGNLPFLSHKFLGKPMSRAVGVTGKRCLVGSFGGETQSTVMYELPGSRH